MMSGFGWFQDASVCLFQDASVCMFGMPEGLAGVRLVCARKVPCLLVPLPFGCPNAKPVVPG